MATRLGILAKISTKPSVQYALSSTVRRFSLNSIRLSSSSIEKVTHTGQVWDKDDIRNTRFVDKQKHVNERFAIDLIDEVPPQASTERIVSCDGGGGPLGHPKVYINLDQPGNHTCGYCGLRFYKEDHH